MNSIVTDAIKEYSRAYPVSRAKMLEMVRTITRTDAALGRHVLPYSNLRAE